MTVIRFLAPLALASILSLPASAQVLVNGPLNANIASTAAALGAPTDAEAPSGNGTAIALSKAQRTILSNLLASYGAPGDAAATASGANGSMIALSKALRDKLNGTLTVGGTVGATQSGAWSFALSSALPAGTNALGSVLSDLRVAGSPVSAGNPVPVVLGAGASSIGSIANTAFGISGSLPAFAATPTFNLGTLNGAATAAAQATQTTTLGAPTDTAYTGSGSASLVAALKGVYNTMIAPTPAGTNVIGRVGIDQTTPGTTNRVFNAAGQPSVSSTVALAAGGTISGTYFSGMGADGTFPYQYGYVTCSAFADQPGTLYVESSIDNATFFPQNGAAGTAVAAGATAQVKVVLNANVMRCRYVNGGTAQTKFFLATTPTRS